jgi:hypothetical protein
MSDQRRTLSSTRPIAASVSSDQRPTSAWVIRPSGRTAVASIVSSPAPESARWPRWITCQSVMQPSTAEYWHIGAITMRFCSSKPPTVTGVNKTLIRDSPSAPAVRRQRSSPPPNEEPAQRPTFAMASAG